MDKLRMESPDMTAQNIDRIAALFPNCITEMLDEEHSTPEKKVYKRAVNFELLKQMLSPDVVDGDEAYEFTWVGKKAAIVEANKPIRKTLRPCVAESKDWDTTENLYIEGDNLEVLKLLQESYLGKVKMIYIDPPYNTGSDKFTYPDNYRQTYSEYEEDLGVFDENEDRLFNENTRNKPHFHSLWCSTIYSRLLLSRNLLKEDGCIFISIDDNEQENMKKMCDEVFGAANYLATFKWNRTAKAPSLSNSVRIKYEYVFCYTKGKRVKLYGKKSYNTQAPLLHLPNKPTTIRFPAGSIEIPHAFVAGIYSEKYRVVLHNNMKEYCGLNENEICISGCFAWSEEKIRRYIDSGLKFLVKKDLGTIYYYMNPEESFIAPADVISDEECGVKRNTEAKDDLRKMGIEFDYSKPVTLIQYLIKATTYVEVGNDSLILDFFSGSATTAHAVMQLNAEDGGHRKFIMVQLPEKCDEASEAYKAGYKNICEIGKERIRRAGDKIKSESPMTTQDLDIGFRVLKLDDTNMKDVYYAPDDYDQGMLAGLESNIKDDRTDLDLLFGCLIDWGLPLSLPYKSEEIDGCTVHTYNDGDLIACFDTNIPESVVKEIAKRKPLRAVFRDFGFASSPEKINVFEIFKLYMPEDASDISKRVRVI